MSTADSRPDIPADIVSSILEHVASQSDLARCAAVNRTFAYAAVPFLYRSLEFRTFRTGAEQRSAARLQEVLLQKPEYATYVRHVGRHLNDTELAGLADAQDLDNKYKALRLCCNLRSFSWIYQYPTNDPSNRTELSNDLSILVTLPVRTLWFRTNAGIAEEGWASLTQFTRLQSLDVRLMHTVQDCPLYDGWADNLRESLISCSLPLGGSRVSKQDEELAMLSELRNLRHVRIRGANTFAFFVLQALPNLESIDTQYTAARTEISTRPFTALLKHLVIHTTVPTSPLAAYLWKMIMQLAPRCSLETLKIQTASTKIGVPSHFVRELAEIHGSTLKRFSVGTMFMDASDIGHLCRTCPKLEYISCAVEFASDDMRRAIAQGDNLRHLNITLNQYSPWGEPYVDEKAAKAWMLREGSRLRIVQISREIYEGQWVLHNDSTLSFDVTRRTEVKLQRFR